MLAQYDLLQSPGLVMDAPIELQAPSFLHPKLHPVSLIITTVCYPPLSSHVVHLSPPHGPARLHRLPVTKMLTTIYMTLNIATINTVTTEISRATSTPEELRSVRSQISLDLRV